MFYYLLDENRNIYENNSKLNSVKIFIIRERIRETPLTALLYASHHYPHNNIKREKAAPKNQSSCENF